MIEDAVGPVFDGSIKLDFNTEELTLNFNEPVDVSRLDGSAMTLYDDDKIVADTLSLNLTGGSTRSSNERTIVFDFSDTDMNALKLLRSRGLCRKESGSDCYVGLLPSFINDTTANPLQAGVLPLQTTSVVFDSTQPNVTQVALDMEQGILTMIFNEPVEDSTTDLTGITLQNKITQAASTSSLVLRAKDSTTSSDSTQVT